MKVCRVIGKVDSSVKLPMMQGLKLLIVQDIGPSRDFTGKVLLCADTLGAGSGDIVAVTVGPAAQSLLPGDSTACDAVITGIIDTITLDPKR